MFRQRGVSLMITVACVACAVAPVSPPARPIIFGVTRPIGAQAAQEGATALSDYISRTVATGSTARVFDDAKQLALALATGSIQAAWLTPGAYIEATQNAGTLRPLFKFSRNGATTYRSVLIAKTGGPSALEDYRGKTLALVVPGSLSGRTYPLALLMQEKIDPATFFAHVIDAKDHAEVCSLVLSGKVELGATLADSREDGPLVADGCREAGLDPRQFAIVASTGPVPNDVIAVRADLDAATVDALRQALVGMAATDDGRKMLHDVFRADGIAPVADADFEIARQLVALAAKAR